MINLQTLLEKSEIVKLRRKIKKINKLEPIYEKLNDEELRNKTIEFKERLRKGETLDNLLVEAFAVVRETAKRVLKMRHFDVQLMGGIVLHQGNVAEMKTGEGKTLVATLPAYLNALEGKGVHIVTVNDYLAKRDYHKMGQIFEFLGLSVGLIQHDMKPDERKEAYSKDITYVTNSEVGFDYLRDNLAKRKEEKVLRNLHYAIIDEADSILIDEARTPLIISTLTNQNKSLYIQADKFVKTLTAIEEINSVENEIDYNNYDVIFNRADKKAILTDKGVAKAEKFFNLKNYSDYENSELIHCINQALKANFLFKKDVDYIILNGKIELVDEFTGRILKGRMYSEGLHQAIEAKEGLEISPENKTIASITYQNLFNLYTKKAGMTGTAKTEEEEFLNIYNMSVISIPTNKPVIRKDLEDIVFLTKEEKYDAIIEDIKKCYEIKRPVLIGTPNIEVSEEISKRLKAINIPHNVLNAKNHEKEAEIVKQAGQLGAVTVATNMAGRGTDIILGKGVKELGGLKVIGVERNEARRIDDQLRGRAGRQGDPGESIFYLSLEDDLLKLFGTDKYIMMFRAMNIPKGKAIKNKMLSKAIRDAQKNLEGINFTIRKAVMQFDTVINKQRETIYNDRDKLLAVDNMIDVVLNMTESVVKKLQEKYKNEEDLKDNIKNIFGIDVNLNEDIVKKLQDYYLNKISNANKHSLSEMYKDILISIVDYHWSNYINEIEHFQREIALKAYAHKDPLVEFTNESFVLFNNLTLLIQQSFLKNVYKLKLELVLNIMNSKAI